MKRNTLLFVMLLLMLAALPIGNASAAANENPGVLPPNSHPAGHSYAEWAALWWQWAYQFPTSASPVAGNAPCSAGQSGKVWFLAGTLGGADTRYCAIPNGMMILMPIINGNCGDARGVESEAAKRSRCGARFSLYGGTPAQGITILEMEVDGVPLQNLGAYRAQSPLTTFVANGPNLGGFPSGYIYDYVADGYQVMLAPLSPGEHTVHTHGRRVRPDSSYFDTEVTYYLTVGK